MESDPTTLRLGLPLAKSNLTNFRQQKKLTGFASAKSIVTGFTQEKKQSDGVCSSQQHCDGVCSRKNHVTGFAPAKKKCDGVCPMKKDMWSGLLQQKKSHLFPKMANPPERQSTLGGVSPASNCDGVWGLPITNATLSALPITSNYWGRRGKKCLVFHSTPNCDGVWGIPITINEYKQSESEWRVLPGGFDVWRGLPNLKFDGVCPTTLSLTGYVMFWPSIFSKPSPFWAEVTLGSTFDQSCPCTLVRSHFSERDGCRATGMCNP